MTSYLTDKLHLVVSKVADIVVATQDGDWRTFPRVIFTPKVEPILPGIRRAWNLGEVALVPEWAEIDRADPHYSKTHKMAENRLVIWSREGHLSMVSLEFCRYCFVRIITRLLVENAGNPIR